MNLDHQPIYVLNISGGHGHFLCYLLDRLCTDTPNIDTLPFNNLGSSHLPYKKSGKFIFIDDPQTEQFLETNKNKDAIMITIEDEIVYWERSCLYRAGDAGTDLFDENSISNFLTQNGSSFPKICKEKNISIKTGYQLAFQNLNECGAKKHDNERKNFAGVKHNNLYFFPLSNFLLKETLQQQIIELSKFFKFNINLNDFNEIYETWYKHNHILHTQNHIEQYQKGNISVELDIIQQAYIDAIKN